MYALTSLSTSRPCIVFVGHVGVAFCGSPGIQLCDAGENAAIVVDVESPGPFFWWHRHKNNAVRGVCFGVPFYS